MKATKKTSGFRSDAQEALHLLDALAARGILTHGVTVGGVTLAVSLTPISSISAAAPRETESIYSEYVGRDAARLIEEGMSNDLV